MGIGARTLEKSLCQHGFSPSYPNLLALRDELEGYNREDYDTIADALEDAIENLESMCKLKKEG